MFGNQDCHWQWDNVMHPVHRAQQGLTTHSVCTTSEGFCVGAETHKLTSVTGLRWNSVCVPRCTGELPLFGAPSVSAVLAHFSCTGTHATWVIAAALCTKQGVLHLTKPCQMLSTLQAFSQPWCFVRAEHLCSASAVWHCMVHHSAHLCTLSANSPPQERDADRL